LVRPPPALLERVRAVFALRVVRRALLPPLAEELVRRLRAATLDFRFGCAVRPRATLRFERATVFAVDALRRGFDAPTVLRCLGVVFGMERPP
jgi:hypothetical protein